MQVVRFFLLLHAALICRISIAQKVNCDDTRYSQAMYFKESEIDSSMNVVYGYARNWKGETDTLHMDFYYPNKTIDKLSKRPYILLIHPGGFVTGYRKHMRNMCRLLAQRGFVVSTIDYRTGWRPTGNTGNTETDCTGNVELFKDAVYRATQDARAAMRYSAANAVEYKLDTAWFFIGGASAGAATAMCTAFCNQSEINEKLEKQEMKFGAVGLASNNLKNQYTIKGALNMWGALFSDMHIGSDDPIPTIMFHGEKDPIVPYYISRFNNCYLPVPYPIVHGSKSLAKRFKILGICYELHSNPLGQHVAFNDKYVAARTSCFFKQIMCGTCTSSEQNTLTQPECSKTKETE